MEVVIPMKRYVIVGAGARGSEFFAAALAREYSDVAEIAGVYDTNRRRAEILKEGTGKDFPVYASFEEMIKGARPDTVIVATVDCHHHEYIIKALEAGCDAISEKPLTIDEVKCNAILEAEKRTGKKVTVTFNYRFVPFAARIKELVKSGAVGKVLSVHFEWLLDTCHGADYFRRWHRNKEKSGGLLVHKSTHHFDLVNWVLEDEPETVNAFGGRLFYGPVRAERGDRCLNCAYKQDCTFHMDINQHEKLKKSYLEAEQLDGYIRDKCIFGEDIDIEDTMSLNVRYTKGAVLSYSLTAHSPYEGYRLNINGTDGRLEAEVKDGAVGAFAGERIYKLALYDRQGGEIKYRIPISGEEHAGGDTRLLRMLFRGDLSDPLKQQAGSRAGAMSAIIGIAANKSMEEERQVRVSELLDFSNFTE